VVSFESVSLTLNSLPAGMREERNKTDPCETLYKFFLYILTKIFISIIGEERKTAGTASSSVSLPFNYVNVAAWATIRNG
jgi:hypothetical protein